MYTEEEEYEDYKSWRDDMEFMDGYMISLTAFWMSKFKTIMKH